MNYSIVHIDGVRTGVSIDFGKDGNRYYISIGEKKNTSTTRIFDEHSMAVVALHTLLDFAIDGCSYEEYKKKLKEMGNESNKY